MPNRPATFKTEQLKTPDSDWDNVVVIYDGVTVKTFVNGDSRSDRYETEITKTGIIVRNRIDDLVVAKIPVILDENVPEDKVYVFNGSDNLEEINKAKKLLSDRGILNHDDIAEAAGSIWDSTITPSVAKLNHVHAMGNHDGFTKEAYHVNYSHSLDPPTDEDFKALLSAADTNNVLDWSKVKEQIANHATAENVLENWQGYTVEQARIKAKELLQNSFIKTSLLESEKAKEQPTEFYKNLKKGVFGSTLDYKMIPDEPEGKSLNMWLRNIVTDDKD
jgi:hypothetical protein